MEDKKKLIIIGGSVVGLIVVILLITFLISIFKPKYYTYEEFEDKIVEATKEYYKLNPTMLPVSDGEHHLSYSTLVSAQMIKPIEEMLKTGVSCTVDILVTKYGDNYSYIPYLSCPGEYETKELYKAILENNPVVTTGKGLYKENEEHVFKGEVENNYLKFDEDDDDYWKIVKVNPDNTIKIIQLEQTISDTFTWDDRYNEERESNYGYNDFELSRMKDTLLKISSSETVLSDTDKNKLVAKNWCIGKRSETETDKTGAVECSVMSEDNILFGLLTVSEIINASLDPNCVNSVSTSCINYNFITKNKTSTWTLTGATEKSYRVYYYNFAGPKASSAYTERKLILATNISNRAFYKSGNGTYEDPYIVR